MTAPNAERQSTRMMTPAISNGLAAPDFFTWAGACGTAAAGCGGVAGAAGRTAAGAGGGVTGWTGMDTAGEELAGWFSAGACAGFPQRVQNGPDRGAPHLVQNPAMNFLRAMKATP